MQYIVWLNKKKKKKKKEKTGKITESEGTHTPRYLYPWSTVIISSQITPGRCARVSVSTTINRVTLHPPLATASPASYLSISPPTSLGTSYFQACNFWWEPIHLATMYLRQHLSPERVTYATAQRTLAMLRKSESSEREIGRQSWMVFARLLLRSSHRAFCDYYSRLQCVRWERGERHFSLRKIKGTLKMLNINIC